MAVEIESGWPESPYKGLGFYTEEDAPLFAGRDSDIVRCAERLAEWSSRVLLLHGSTGCGKSSFLRAGLIPHLEGRNTGIEFARIGVGVNHPALMIRSTSEPLPKIANALYQFAARDITLTTPDGPFNLNLRASLPDPNEQDASSFVRQYGNDPHALLMVLEGVARLIPETIVLIIDQGEEVLTVNRSGELHERSNSFFQFLSGFTDSQIDVKLVIALRTEYLGRFASRLRNGLRDKRVTEYFLDELSVLQIKEAILHPTSTIPLGRIGSPHDKYLFTFDDRVVDAIINQLDRAAGGKLTAVQIVCGALYDLVRGRPGSRKITFGDLDSIGGVEGAIERFLDKNLIECAEAEHLSFEKYEEEIVLWKKALCKFALLQPDGTVTTDIRNQEIFERELKAASLSFKATTEKLLNARVLRETNVVDVQSGSLVRCFGLGHDTLGLVLRNWKVRHDRNAGYAPVDSTPTGFDEETTALTAGTALCLSGSGYRAVAFQIGVVWRLYEAGLLRRLTRISGVSGGSIVAGFLALKWKSLSFRPESLAHEFIPRFVSPLRVLVSNTIDSSAIVGGLLLPGGSGIDRVARAFDEYLFSGATLQDMPDEPRFIFSATNVQSGAVWRFAKPYMGDYRVGEVSMPRVPLAHAIAASAALPPMLSPFILKLPPNAYTPGKGFDLQAEAFKSEVVLTDGGVIDRLALETTWKSTATILVSDGGLKLQAEATPHLDWARHSARVLSLIDHQVRALRKRQLIESFISGVRKGAYWGIETDISDYDLGDALPHPIERVKEFTEVPVRYQALDNLLQERLINWGYAVCDAAVRKHVEPTLRRPIFPYPSAR
ncbi:MAG TPA: patatin-like phospholipase family protein [Pseudolabrys sp.]|nr:patatin-like phospholipase family protein [Pseudolabrys sp.]